MEAIGKLIGLGVVVLMVLFGLSMLSVGGAVILPTVGHAFGAAFQGITAPLQFLPGLLSAFMTAGVCVVFAFFMLTVVRLTFGEKGKKREQHHADESQVMQRMYQQGLALEKRMEALETILISRSEIREKSPF
jgi:L-asparagine transporter-like permease